MLPEPRRHHFQLEGAAYTLTEYTRAGERRIHQHYALALSVQGTTPALMQTLDGDNLYCEAVARECLTEAPDYWWESTPIQSQASKSSNGAVMRTVSFENVPTQVWQAFCKEVEAFLASLFPVAQSAAGDTTSSVPESAHPVAPTETVPARFVGRAE